MMRLRALGLSATLAVGTLMPVVAADPPKQTTLAAKLFGSSKSKSKAKAAKPAAQSALDAPAKPSTPAASGLSTEAVFEALRAEQDAYLRRLGVCGELRRIGGETNNTMLIRQADELERQAAALYNQRTAALGVPRVKSPLPEPTATEFTQATPSFDSRTAANRLTAPAAPTPAADTAEAKKPIAASAPNAGGKP